MQRRELGAFFSNEAWYQALEKKVAGAIRMPFRTARIPVRACWSRPSPSESIMAEGKQKKGILEEWANCVHKTLAKPEYANYWEPYPFNSGYFMCLKLKGLDAETFRKHLLEKYGVGVIADGEGDIRVAFSAVEVERVGRPLRADG